YWTPDYPRFVSKSSLKDLWVPGNPPRLKVIGDISCDINGSVECTEYATTPEDPIFVYDPIEETVTDGHMGRGVVVMAVDNLPAEISLESSVSFSTALKPFVPEIARADFSGDFSQCQLPPPIKRAVILYRGQFTPEYEYMKDYINTHKEQ
ncbi:hypothetical protein ACFLT9_14470, partial [Acidobacteriota bacterium]